MGKSKLTVGDLVRVKCDILYPNCGWGAVSPGDVGTITSVDGRRCRVNFAKDRQWKGMLKELEPVMHEADRAVEGVIDMYEHLFNTKRFEDVAFVLADGREGAHKVVLSAASDAFAAMFEQPMQEGQSGQVDLPNVKWVTMRVFLRLMYTGLVDARDWQDESPASSGGGGHAKGPEADDRGEEEYEDAVDDGCDSGVGEENDDTDDGEAKERNEEAFEAAELEPEKSQATTHVEVPLETLCEVAGLAQKYMVHNVLQLAIEALKIRLQKAVVEKNVAVFEEIMSVAISMGLGAVRTAAVQVAKKSKAIWKRYDLKQLRPEVELELQAVWPPPRPRVKARHAWLS
mmetsp:Transcript_19208/g.25797  ORF Transcript_19208/g.25797 Transcript_19208/m.25797 type:complete len:344 (+) Transcript_19208:38-1069(+)